MAFTKYKGGLLPPHPEFVKPRVWADDFTPGPGKITEVARALTADWASQVRSWPMDLNGPDPSNPPDLADGLGTCGIAGLDHLQMADHAYGDGNVRGWGNDVVLQLYEQLGGYRRGDPSTDQGTNLQDNLAWWRNNPVQGDEILGFAALRPGTWFRAERVYYQRVFGPLYLGHYWPVSAEQQFDTSAPLAFVPGSANAGGHCTDQIAEMTGTGEVHLACWGRDKQATRGFFMATVFEAWVAVTQAVIERNGANQYGYDMAAMNDAITSLTRQSNPLRLSNYR